MKCHLHLQFSNTRLLCYTLCYLCSGTATKNKQITFSCLIAQTSCPSVDCPLSHSISLAVIQLKWTVFLIALRSFRIFSLLLLLLVLPFVATEIKILKQNSTFIGFTTTFMQLYLWMTNSFIYLHEFWPENVHFFLLSFFSLFIFNGNNMKKLLDAKTSILKYSIAE